MADVRPPRPAVAADGTRRMNPTDVAPIDTRNQWVWVWGPLNPKTGKREKQRVLTTKLSPQQLAAARSNGLNGPASQNPATNPKPATNPTTPPVATPTVDGSLDAWKTDPYYQEYKAGIDYDRAMAKQEYDSAMGVDGADGSLGANWKYGLNELTRGNRQNISQTNAELSGSNLSGSGIARKSLSDLAAAFFADQSKMNTDYQRDVGNATQAWQNAQTAHSTKDISLMAQAADQWKQRNIGVVAEPTTATPAATPAVTPAKPTARAPVVNGLIKPGRPTDPRGPAFNTAPVAPKPKAVAPPGMQYVLNKATGKYTLKPKAAR